MVRHICHRRRWSYSRRQQTDLARLYAFSGHFIRRFVDNIIIHILRKRWPCETSQSSEYFTLRISAQPKTNFERKYFDNFDRSIRSVSEEQHNSSNSPATEIFHRCVSKSTKCTHSIIAQDSENVHSIQCVVPSQCPKKYKLAEVEPY